jgi:hypothetical protein
MKLWSAEVCYRLKTKSYWSREVRLSVKAGRAHLAAAQAIGRTYAPKGVRIEQWRVTLTDLGKVTVQQPTEGN